jgi:hypothetical protein
MNLSETVAQFRLEDPEDELTREVFAHFGRAFYMANCLERGLAGALLQVEWRANLRPPMTRAQYDAQCKTFEAECSRLPMGPLVKRLLAQPGVSDDLRELLEAALEARNHLAHHYFWERAGEFTVVPDGQLYMITECDEATSLFGRADVALEQYLKPYLARHGVTDDALNEAQQHVIEDARDRLSERR